ncbi:hypothetical protein AVEN_17257-1 [Araneus ventricosus]|uniref:Uncharacterized protein n=1 Tax=Araneus ventricosus TaxID=182803 RepID=A0A4Y2LZ05_ARAVE|nr:hypothetical protein AVEN_17257-1 [Araneus ventricosus]
MRPIRLLSEELGSSVSSPAGFGSRFQDIVNVVHVAGSPSSYNANETGIWQLLPKKTDGAQQQGHVSIKQIFSYRYDSFKANDIYQTLRAHWSTMLVGLSRCVPLATLSSAISLGREHALWTPQQWSCMMFSTAVRFSLQSDSRRRTFHMESADLPVTTKRTPVNDTAYGGSGWLV